MSSFQKAQSIFSLKPGPTFAREAADPDKEVTVVSSKDNKRVSKLNISK